MPAKGQKTSKAKLAPQSESEAEKKGTAEIKPPEQPVVTQVVEVVEDTGKVSAQPNIQTTVTPPVSPVQQQPITGSDPTTGAATTQPSIMPTTPVTPVEIPSSFAPPAEEKQKEVVSELFQKNESVGYPEISEHKPSALKAIAMWSIIIIVIALVVGGGLILWMRGTVTIPAFIDTGGQAGTGNTTPTVATSPSTPTPTPEPVKREDVTISVLNGAGTAGTAGKMKKFLEDKGYKVTEVGNADNFTYDSTEVTVKAAKKAYLTLLVDDLKAEYSLGTTAATLAESATTDARVIVGKE